MNRFHAFLLFLIAALAAPAAQACGLARAGASFACTPGAEAETIASTDHFIDHGASSRPGADFAFLDGLGASERFVETSAAAVTSQALGPAQALRGTAAFGPFRVLDEGRAALVDATDERSPAAFAALLRAHPGIRVLELIECPGTEDDRGNLAVGRMIRARGIATHVPRGGSVRSGGVELFLAGTHRSAEDGAEFAVHAWMDDAGREPDDYAANAPENRKYLDYYREMGMSPAEASAFYTMTNSVHHQDAKWLTAADMRQWVRLD